MARLGGLIREAAKRSLATLAKNGQLPFRDYEADEEYNPYNSDKRNIGSIARGGTMSGKRNVGSLARDYVLPSSGKRNLPSILRSGGGGSTSSSSTHGPQSQPKRSIATLARENQLPYYHPNKNEKRDVAAAASNKCTVTHWKHIYTQYHAHSIFRSTPHALVYLSISKSAIVSATLFAPKLTTTDECHLFSTTKYMPFSILLWHICAIGLCADYVHGWYLRSDRLDGRET